MKEQYWLKEDRTLQKMSVSFSTELSQRIDDIIYYNRNNIDGLSQWHNYLDGLVNYISNPVVAWDNMNWYQHFPNGTTIII